MLEQFRIIILPRASADIVRTFDYVETNSPQNAISVASQVITSIDSLAQMPKRFKVHQSNRNPDRKVYALSVTPFIVYYRVLETEQVVLILTVRHGAQRQPRRF